jgi:hypothetical protein
MMQTEGLSPRTHPEERKILDRRQGRSVVGRTVKERGNKRMGGNQKTRS